MAKEAFVYILSNGYRKLYIGITTELAIRVRQHKEKRDPCCHTARYNINQLVYFERFSSPNEAIAREKTLKGWLRIRKLELIIGSNPGWLDLSLEFGARIEAFDKKKHQAALESLPSFQ